ncbi:MAG TPA: guanylate kinase [Gemmatimonadales bacterium]
MSERESGRARLFVLSAPSGAGKTTIVQALVDRRSDVAHSVSATTREPRAGERDGIDYHFLTRDAFEQRVAAGDFLEWAEYSGHLYGTLASEVDGILAGGKHVVLDIEVRGARQLRQRRDDVVTIFILPPAAEALLERLGGRSADRPEQVARRMRRAMAEIEEAPAYDFVLENRDLEMAIRDVAAIVDGARAGLEPGEVENRVVSLRTGLARLAKTMNADR